MDSEEARKAEERAQRYKAHLKNTAFPTIGKVYSIHLGPNRAQRRAAKFRKNAS